VRGFHVPADIETGASCQSAELVHKQLPRPLVGIQAAPRSEAGEARILSQHRKQVVDDRGNGVISAQSLVERSSKLLLLRDNRHGHSLFFGLITSPPSRQAGRSATTEA
jgi:hypothetical protein